MEPVAPSLDIGGAAMTPVVSGFVDTGGTVAVVLTVLAFFGIGGAGLAHEEQLRNRGGGHLVTSLEVASEGRNDRCRRRGYVECRIEEEVGFRLSIYVA